MWDGKAGEMCSPGRFPHQHKGCNRSRPGRARGSPIGSITHLFAAAGLEHLSRFRHGIGVRLALEGEYDPPGRRTTQGEGQHGQYHQ